MIITKVLKNGGIYSFLHLLSEYVLIPHLLNNNPSKVTQLPASERIELAEKLSSTIHALRIGLLSFKIIFLEKLYQGNAVFGYAQGTDDLYADHMGYTLYDIWVMYKQNIRQTDMWIHHILGFLGALAITKVRTFAFCPTIFTVTELTVPVANALWMWSRFGDKKSPLYTFLLFTRLWQYLLLRLGVVPYMLYYFLRNYRKARKEEEEKGGWREDLTGLITELLKLPKWVLLFSLFQVTSFSLLNVKWTTLMLKNFIQHLQLRYSISLF